MNILIVSICCVDTKWSLLIVLIFLMIIVFGEEPGEETLPMGTDVNNINEENKLTSRDVRGANYRMSKPRVRTESNFICGLRAANLRDQRADSFQEQDSDDLDSYDDDKILGGNFALQGEVPWQANIRIAIRKKDKTEYKAECSGAIINEYWIITAAHCFRDEPPSSFRVSVGDYHVTRNDPEEQQFVVSKIIIHEKYRRPGFDYDIALLKIQKGQNGHGMKFNKFIQPVCLPEETDYPGVGTQMLASGWGRDKLSGPSSPGILKKTLLPLIDQKECSQLFNGLITPRMSCAGYSNGPTDMCRADSGAPAAYKFMDIYILFGIASFGTDCAFPNYPSVFTNIRSNLQWIFENLKLHSNNKWERKLPERPDWIS